MSNANTTIKDGFGAAAEDFYSALLTVHEGLDVEQSTTLNARLVLLLANEVGDLERVKTIMQLARTIEPA